VPYPTHHKAARLYDHAILPWWVLRFVLIADERDLFPDVEFPFVVVTTIYPEGPEAVATDVHAED
jgi:hypothetical protein